MKSKPQQTFKMEGSSPALIILKQYKSIESKPPSRLFCLTWTPSCLALIPLDLHHLLLLDLLEPPGGHKKTVCGIACKTCYERVNGVVKNLLPDLVLRQSQEVIDGAVQIFISTIPKTRQKPGKQKPFHAWHPVTPNRTVQTWGKRGRKLNGKASPFPHNQSTLATGFKNASKTFGTLQKYCQCQRFGFVGLGSFRW